jgi:formylglycine-generating enzyme required for sulfatase activity
MVAGCGVLGLGLVAWAQREELATWYRFFQRFERLGPNEQGYLEYRHRSTGMVMVRIPGGTFAMGSPETEDGAWANERPQHRVTLDAFLIARHEVTQAIWRQIMDGEPSKFTGDTLPVEQVSWDDCREFCRRTGLSLPTEAQWEYACRSGRASEFAFGDGLTSAQANFDGNFPYVQGAAAGTDLHRTPDGRRQCDDPTGAGADGSAGEDTGPGPGRAGLAAPRALSRRQRVRRRPDESA